MNVASNVTSVTTQVSGAVAIGSASVSKTAEYVASSAPPEVVQKATTVMTNSEMLALASFAVMLVSFVWNVYSTRRRDKLNLEMREKELQLEREKFEHEKKKGA